MKTKSEKGLFIGESHDNGGIPSKVIETGQKIEIEGDEYYICREAYNSPDEYDFKGKTNRQVLDKIYSEHSCKLIQSEMSAGDFIVCKLVVKDTKKHNRKGTIKSILNEMQGEKSCRVESGSQRKLRQGGSIGDVIKMDVPLFIRMLEYAKEDAKSDVDLHLVTENAIKNNRKTKPLTMSDYDSIVDIDYKKAKGGVISEYFNEELSFLNW